METEMLNSSHSDFLEQGQEELFFTELNYKKYSCLPSFVEYLEKHISCHEEPSTEHKKSVSNGCIDTGNAYVPSACSAPQGHNSVQEGKFIGTEREGTNLFPSCRGPEIEFPVVSRISVENQKMFLEEFEALRSGKLEKVDFQRLKTLQDMKKVVMTEQEEFQKFVYHHAKKNHHLYNFIHSDIWADYKTEAALKGGTSKYPQHYSLHETLGLAVGAVFKTDAVLTFEKTLLQVGDVPKLVPGKTGVMLLKLLSLPFDEKTEDRPVHARKQTVKVVSHDPMAITLANKHQVDVVISSSGMNCLLDNQPPDYRQQWQLPITVQLRETPDTSCRKNVVFIDKPLPPKNVNPRDVNFKSFKRAFRKLVCKSCRQVNPLVDAERQSSRSGLGLDAPDEKEETGVDCLTNVNSEKSSLAKQRVPEFDEINNRMRVSTENLSEVDSPVINESEPGTRENNKLQTSREGTTSVPTCKESKFLVYNLWKFGKLRILIRCSVDAYREEAGSKQGTYSFFSVLPKLEYQCNFGYERLTASEATRFWLHSYIRPKTKLLCGRINVFNSELLRFDELDINDILRAAVGFNPAQGMKMVFQVLQAFTRLPEGKYVFSHNLGEIHGCVYKSMPLSSGNFRFAYDLHNSQRSPVIMNYTDAQIPWTAIDYNLFMPWQITGNRIPGTFPPVPDDELAKEMRKGQEANKKSSKKNRKTNKTKKKNQRKANKTDMSSGRKQSPNMAKLFASFYDTQPAERESEAFAVSRRASAPVTYDDIEF